MRAELYQGPLDAYPTAALRVTRAVTIAEVLAAPDLAVPEWFLEYGVVKLGGHVIERHLWHKVRLKPESPAVLELCVVQQKQAIATVLAVVAVAAAIAIGTFGIPFLGIAAGSLWANVIAAGIGIAAQLAIRALTAAPLADNSAAAGGVQKVTPGISSNTPVMNDALPVIFGKIGFSPPHMIPPYTTWNSTSSSIVAVMGFQGPCQINKVLINGMTEDQIAGLQIEKREGWASDAPRTIGTETVIEVRPGQALTNFDTLQQAGTNDPLRHQPLNQADVPQWHGLVTSGNADDFTIRLLAASGFADSGTPTAKIKVPLRLRIRRKGDTTWRNLPEIHLQDILHGTGQWRAEVRCKFAKPPGGILYVRNDAWNVYSLTNKAGRGTTYEWDSDPYFQGSAAVAHPVFTAATTSGYTVSASSEGGGPAWWAFDNVDPNHWIPTALLTAGPQWLKMRFPAATVIGSYSIGDYSTEPSGRRATKWLIEGSNDDVTYVALDDAPIDVSAAPNYYRVCNITRPAAYQYYRITFLANADPAQFLEVNQVYFYAQAALGSTTSTAEAVGQAGYIAVHSGATTEARCCNAALDQDGVTFYLDPAQWPKGQYEIQLMRGCASPDGTFNPYTYAVGTATSGFFAPLNVSGQWVAPYGYYYRSDLQVEVMQTHQAVAPFDPTGICLVAISAPDIQISSIYVEATSFAPDFDGQVWTEKWVPQNNPAALYRQVLLGAANAMPAPGEVVDEAELAAWFNTCKARGYQCNAVLQGARVAEALQMIASAGYAAPRTANFFGVVEDKDTSAQPVSYAITPLNSRDQGTKVEALANLPHAIHATYYDETDSYAQNQVDVFRDGYDITTAKLWETVTYTGHTAAAKAQARAKFDLRQLTLRPRKYVREVGMEGYLLRRGDLVAINDDVLSGNHAAGWISKVNTSGGNVVSIVLENIMPWSRSSSIDAVGDVSALADILNPATPMAVAIRVPGQSMVVRQITEVLDANTCTFAVPIPDDGSIQPDQMVIAGTFNDTHRRVKIFEIQPKGFESFTVTMVDEAPQLFT